MRKAILGLGCLVVLLACRPGSAMASGTLSEAVGELARDVKSHLDIVGKNKVSIGQFSGKGDLGRHSSSGPLLYTALETELRKLKVDVVDKKADFELSGEYSDIEDPLTSRQFVLIKLELRDRQGNSRFFEGIENDKVTKYYVKNEADMAKLLGPASVYVPADASDKERIDAWKKPIDDPEAVIDGTRILAAKNAPFALEILTAPLKAGGGKHDPKDYRVRQPQAKSGLAFVPIAREEVYGVRLINNADFDVAVDIRIDGLSMFQASDGKFRDKKTGAPLYRFLIVPKKSSTTFIRGWFITLEDSDEFLVTEYAKSEAGKIGQSANVGTITVNFHAAWDKKASPPPDEPRNPNEYSFSADATGRGNRINERYEVVDYQIGIFRGAVSVRYAK